MRPHEEKWRAEGDVVVAELEGVERGILQCTYRDEGNGRLSRADFVAACPHLYRTLFQILEASRRLEAASEGHPTSAGFELIGKLAEEAMRVADPSDPHLDRRELPDLG